MAKQAKPSVNLTSRILYRCSPHPWLPSQLRLHTAASSPAMAKASLSLANPYPCFSPLRLFRNLRTFPPLLQVASIASWLIKFFPKALVHSVVIEIQSGHSSSVQTSAVRQLIGSLTRTGGLRFAVVVARFNELLTKLLLEGALDTFRKYSVGEEDIDIRGDTSHYDAVANSAASGVLSAGLSSGSKSSWWKSWE